MKNVDENIYVYDITKNKIFIMWVNTIIVLKSKQHGQLMVMNKINAVLFVSYIGIGWY